MNIRALFSVIIAAAALSAQAAKPFDEAKALYDSGSYEAAAESFQRIVKKTPRDAAAQYYLGISLLELGRTSEAMDALGRAEDRGNAPAARLLAEMALDEYRADDAIEHLDTWGELLAKAKKSAPAELAQMQSRAVQLKNMLERVEKIAIIDSVTVDSARFFEHYALTAPAGRILPGSALPPQYQSGASVAYIPELSTELIWAAPDSTGMMNLFSASILDDGTMESPSRMPGNPGEGGNANYPFLMPDGVTLYFANDGPNSLGGYDIFFTRRDSDGSLLQPQNMGMPYNSPSNDYMLAIDEATGLGWWATDRNAPQGRVTVYTFVPSETRVNYSPDDPDIAARARVDAIAPTQTPGVDYAGKLAAAREAASASREAADSPGAAFEIAMGNGTVYTSLSQFRNRQARQAMEQWLERDKELRRLEAQLSALRAAYAKGNRANAKEILSIERRIPALRENLRRIANQVIRLETK